MLGIGTDIVAIARFEQSWKRRGDRLAIRVLTPEECERCHRCPQPWRYLAKRFAAKEAIAKALGCGIGGRLSWQDLRIDNDAAGAPQVQLSARAEALLRECGGARILLSIADEQEYAVAFAALVA